MMKLLMQGGTASAIFILSLVIASGLYLGRFKVKGVSLGSTWILFVGILLSHFGLRINPTMLGFIKDFGLILFVFAIGLQVGPGFFRSFRKDGLSMNIMAIVMVALAVGTTYVIHLVTGEDLAIMTGVMSGAVTNTPGLGAAQQILEEGGVNSGPIASAYAVAYPLGVLGALFVVIVCKALFRIDLDKEREKASKGDSTDANAYRLACRVENPALFGKSIHDIVGEVNSDHLVIARMKRGEDIFFPDLDMPLKEGDELLIVTNHHVVADSSELTVSFIDEESVEAVVKGTDAGNDLAVVAVKLEDIPAETMSQIRIANVADSEDVRVGEQVVAIGNALGYGQSVTTGIVSALDRTITVADESGYNDYTELIQTDAAINQGNSGGALLNMKGEVIGINSVKAGASGVEGMGYAISTAKAIPIIRNLMNKETRELVDDEDRSYLGIVGQDVTSNVAQVYGIPEGIYVTDVSENGPAAEAGITQGMIITGFDGNAVEGMDDLQDLLPYYAGGETVSITMAVQSEEGGYQEKEFTITLGLRSDYVQDTQ